MTLNTFGLYRQTNILADFASNAYSKNGIPQKVFVIREKKIVRLSHSPQHLKFVKVVEHDASH